MFNVMATQSNIGGALCESSVIPFLVLRHSLADARCWSAVLPIRESARLGRKVILHLAKLHEGARAPENIYVCIYSVPAHKTTKHRAKFGWPPVRCQIYSNLLGCPKLMNRSQPLVGRSLPYCRNMWRR